LAGQFLAGERGEERQERVDDRGHGKLPVLAKPGKNRSGGVFRPGYGDKRTVDQIGLKAKWVQPRSKRCRVPVMAGTIATAYQRRAVDRRWLESVLSSESLAHGRSLIRKQRALALSNLASEIAQKSHVLTR